MKTTEKQQISSDAASAQATPAQSSTAGEKFKKPHLKLFNCLMKPSLSLTSLPPQSPKEASDEAQSVERPYNSLKVISVAVVELALKISLKKFQKKRDAEKELWRRSWESTNSISTTTSHTGTSGGRNGNDFWSAYNFIMDTNLIDTCREASGETSKSPLVNAEFKAFKSNGDSMVKLAVLDELSLDWLFFF
jgi:hypothetical protein